MTAICTKVNLGCGPNPVTGWINVDYAIGARLARLPVVGSLVKTARLFGCDWDRTIVIADLRKRFPWKDEIVDAAYSFHTLEHFSKHDRRQFLKECRRVLRPEGILRIAVPDLACIVGRCNSGDLAADDLIDALDVQLETEGSFLEIALRPIFNSHIDACMTPPYSCDSLLRSASPRNKWTHS